MSASIFDDDASPKGEPQAAETQSAHARGLGTPRVHLRQTSSTNDRARELASAGAPHGTLVTADEQTAGRGRGGRRWSAPAGSSLLMSLVLRSPPVLLPLIAAVAACEAVGEQALIKWPNDIVVAAGGETPTHPPLAKLAGILIEGRPQQGWAVLGIGLNVAVRLEELPAELRSDGAPAEPAGSAPAESAGSDAEAAPAHAGLPAATLGLPRSQLEPMLRRLLDALARRLAEPEQATLAAWRARDALRGREVAWDAGHGRADGIDGTGRLILALEDGGRTSLGSGEVRLARIS